MGFPESFEETNLQAVEKGSFLPIKDKDPEKDAYNPKEGICQKLRSLKVPLIYVVVGSAILLHVIIILAVLYGKDRSGNYNCELPEILPGEKPETEVVKESTAAVYLDGWVLYGKKCYYISDRMDTWDNSQNFCKSHDSSLAIIDDEKEMNFLNLLRGNKYWIGLSRAKDDSGWVWADGTSYSGTIVVSHRKPPGNDESENVYLNGEGFTSESGRYPKKWICSKSFLGHPSQYTEMLSKKV